MDIALDVELMRLLKLLGQDKDLEVLGLVKDVRNAINQLLTQQIQVLTIVLTAVHINTIEQAIEIQQFNTIACSLNTLFYYNEILQKFSQKSYL